MVALATHQALRWWRGSWHNRGGDNALNTLHNQVSQWSQMSHHELDERVYLGKTMSLNEPKRSQTQLSVGIRTTSSNFLSAVIESSNVLSGFSRVRQHRYVVSSEANLHKKSQVDEGSGAQAKEHYHYSTIILFKRRRKRRLLERWLARRKSNLAK